MLWLAFSAPFRLTLFWLGYFYQCFNEKGHAVSHGVKELSVQEAYHILQVAPGACPEVIKAAYRALARKHHPDQGGDPAMMQRLNAAYARLIKEG